MRRGHIFVDRRLGKDAFHIWGPDKTGQTVLMSLDLEGMKALLKALEEAIRFYEVASATKEIGY